MTKPQETRPSRGRLIAFRVIAAIGGVLVAVLSIPLGLIGLFDSGPDSIHRIHFVGGALGFGLLTGVTLVLCAWRPDRWIAAFQVALAATVAGLVVGALSGDLVSGGYLIVGIVVAVLIALHPHRSEVFRVRNPILPIAVLSALALIPSIAYALTWSRLQRNGVAADPHVEFHHYSGVAALGIGFSLAGLAVAARATGWRAMAWFVGFSWTAFGVASLGYPDYVSAFPTAWAWTAIVMGIGLVGIAEVRARQGEISPPMAEAS